MNGGGEAKLQLSCKLLIWQELLGVLLLQGGLVSTATWEGQNGEGVELGRGTKSYIRNCNQVVRPDIRVKTQEKFTFYL